MNYNTVKSDYITVGGYSHSILRPFDSVHVPKDIRYSNGKTEKCDWPLFAGGKYQEWCNEEVAIKYHAMRPIVSPDTYESWLVAMFGKLRSPKVPVVSDNLAPNMFCGSQGDVMRWLMGRVGAVVHELPQMQRNGSWKFEQFYETDTQFYSFLDQDNGYAVYKIIFNLYNTLRSISTLVNCVIVNDGKELLVQSIGFVNDPKGQVYDGYEFGSPKYGVGTMPGLHNDEFGWNYGNTLETQKFNEVGFFDPLRNVSIEGGIPDSLRAPMAKCNTSMLMLPETINLTGIDPNTRQPIKNTGQPQWVLADRGVVYGKGKEHVVYY